jgi:hypothetical protein
MTILINKQTNSTSILAPQQHGHKSKGAKWETPLECSVRSAVGNEKQKTRTCGERQREGESGRQNDPSYNYILHVQTTKVQI